MHGTKTFEVFIRNGACTKSEFVKKVRYNMQEVVAHCNGLFLLMFKLYSIIQRIPVIKYDIVILAKE